MIPNLSSLKHRAPARTGPPVDPPSDAECAILMEPLPPEEPAWSPEIVDEQGNVKVEEMHFYDIVALAKWLVTHDTTPLSRSKVTEADRQACIDQANDRLRDRNEPLLAGGGRAPPAPRGEYDFVPDSALYEPAYWEERFTEAAFGRNGLYDRLARYYDRLQERDDPLPEHWLKTHLSFWLSKYAIDILEIQAAWDCAYRVQETARMVAQQASELNYDVLAERPAANWFERAWAWWDHYANRDARRTTYREMVSSNLRRSSTLLWVVQGYNLSVIRPDSFAEANRGQPQIAFGDFPRRMDAEEWGRKMALTMRTAPQAWDAYKLFTRERIRRHRDMNYGLLQRAGYNPLNPDLREAFVVER